MQHIQLVQQLALLHTPPEVLTSGINKLMQGISVGLKTRGSRHALADGQEK